MGLVALICHQPHLYYLPATILATSPIALALTMDQTIIPTIYLSTMHSSPATLESSPLRVVPIEALKLTGQDISCPNRR